MRKASTSMWTEGKGQNVNGGFVSFRNELGRSVPRYEQGVASLYFLPVC